MNVVGEMRKTLCFLMILICWTAVSQPSVLSSGDWYKVRVASSGVYKLDRSALADLGINVDAVDPRTIKVFGNGVKGVLPQPNNEARPLDLLENAIYVSGEADGSFDASDFVLFYGVGPDQAEWESDGLHYEKNIYDDFSYYFINVGGANGRRLEEVPSLPGVGTPISNSDEAIIFEEDVNNILSSGRQWVGELMNDGDRLTFQHSLTNITSDVSLAINGVGQSGSENYFEILANGTSLGNLEIASVPVGAGTTYSIKARQTLDTFFINQTADLELRFDYEANASSGRGYLDYYALLFRKSLSFTGNEFGFRTTDDTGNLLSYQLTNVPEDLMIWNVSDPTTVAIQSFSVNGATVSFQSQSNQVEEFVAFSGSDFATPELVGSVLNQNLKGEMAVDALIITHPDFLSEAYRLADFHRQHDGLSVKVSTTEEVYNEFSSGRQDATAIRDYAKYVYESGNRLKYLLLFGDCSFDYKQRESNNTNFVPTYESRNSFHPIFSHSSDDYFGFLDPTEGQWEETSSGDHTLEIGVGRLPVKTAQEAQIVVDKIVYYSTSPNTLGPWRNEIAYLADDGDANIHVRHVEDLSELIDTTYRQYQIDKLLLDAFEQEVEASRQTSPGATRALKTRIKNGVFAINYIGHGNERQWTAEEVLTSSLIDEFTNRNRLPIFVTATCEFGRYDDPGEVSGAEKLLLMETGGAIALLTTSRPVFASTNFELNEAFHENIFRKVDGSFQRLGDVIRTTKNEGLAGPVNRNFALLGDPMMLPAYPKLEIELVDVGSETDTLSALEQVTFSGRVLDNGVLAGAFNGRVDISVFDIPQDFTTRGQESTPTSYFLRNNAIFRGETTVSNGEFEFSFVVPKNISYQFQNGRISFYAWDEDRNIDAAGAFDDFALGGTNELAPEDNTPPVVSMYLNDETFTNGAVVGRSSLLFASVEDENGISITSSGLSQGVSLTLNDEVINLNQYYSSDLDTYQSGNIVYPLQNLDPGEYTATLTVYDVHNNVSSTEIRFRVSDESFISVFNPMAYPNPVRSDATFSFEHDREEEDLTIELLVYNTQGELMDLKRYEYPNSNRVVEFGWEPLSKSGQLLPMGVYFYRLIIRSNLDGATKEITNRLVIVN